MGRLSWLQNAIVFLVPFAVGLIHSTFAMKALGTLVMKRVIYSGWLVALGYLLVYVAYFAATDAVYRRAIGASRRCRVGRLRTRRAPKTHIGETS